jgi:hypothetical protein
MPRWNDYLLCSDFAGKIDHGSGDSLRMNIERNDAALLIELNEYRPTPPWALTSWPLK